MVDEDMPGEYAAKQLGLSLTSEELAMLDSVSNQDEETRYAAVKTFLDIKTNTGWTTTGHTGVDVEVFAFGAGATSFSGQIDNTDIAKTIFTLLDSSALNK
jgi:alkaline phosphatase